MATAVWLASIVAIALGNLAGLDDEQPDADELAVEGDGRDDGRLGAGVRESRRKSSLDGSAADGVAWPSTSPKTATAAALCGRSSMSSSSQRSRGGAVRGDALATAR